MRCRIRPVLAGISALALVVGIGGCREERDLPGALAEEQADREPPAPSAPLPDDVLLFASNRSGGFEIHAADLVEARPRQLTDDDRYDSWWPRISPDRTRILFYRTPRGVHDTDYSEAALWMMAADGSDATELIPPGAHGWRLQGHAEWSPDGDQLVMFGGGPADAQVYVTDVGGGSPRAVTDRPGVNIDPSWAPTGDEIVFIGCPDAECLPERFEVYRVGADGTGDARRLTDDHMRDQDPYISPDGGRIAWLTQTEKGGGPLGAWNIKIANVDGTDARRLTDDPNVNSKPQWAPDGSTIYFHRLVYEDSKQFKLWRIGVDGAGLEPVFDDQPGVNEFPSL